MIDGPPHIDCISIELAQHHRAFERRGDNRRQRLRIGLRPQLTCTNTFSSDADDVETGVGVGDGATDDCPFAGRAAVVRKQVKVKNNRPNLFISVLPT